MGWSLADFERSSPGDVLHALAWRQRYQENSDRNLWDATRMLGFWLLQPYKGKGKLDKPTDLCPYPWDPKPEPVTLTPEQEAARKEKIARWDRIMRERYGK